MALQGTSSPQGLMALLAVQPPTSSSNPAPAGVLGLPAGLMQGESNAGFSSLLQSLMNGTDAQAGLLPQEQSLPLLAQTEPNSMPPLPTTELELLAQENTDSVLAQLNFGGMQLKPAPSLAGKPATPTKLAATDSGKEDDDTQALSLLPLGLSPAPSAVITPNTLATEAANTTDTTPAVAVALSPTKPSEPAAALLITEPESSENTEPALSLSASHKDSSAPVAASLNLNLHAEATPPTPTSSHALSAAAPSATAMPTAAQVSQSAALAPNTQTFAATADKMDFGDEADRGMKLGSRVLLMVAEGVQSARIHLDPPELGSLEIKLHVQQDQASVQVHAATPQVRDVLEASAARLRDTLASQGLELQHFSVSSGQAGGQGQSGQGQAEGEANTAEGEWLAVEDSAEAPKASSLNLLDTFA